MTLRLLRQFMVERPDGTVDASGVISRECYREWLKTRQGKEDMANAKRYQRVVSNHLSGVDGRCPFTEREEEAVLRLLRRKQPWPCFGPEISIGHTGFRSKGFHEKRRAMIERNENDDDDEDDNAQASSLPHHTKPTFPAMQASPPLVHGGGGGMIMETSHALAHLASNLQAYYVAFEGMGIDVWPSMVGIFKFVALGPTTTTNKMHPTDLRAAEMLCDAHVGRMVQSGHKINECLVLIVDLTREYRHRFAAQSLGSMHYVGRVVGDCEQNLLRPQAVMETILSAGKAFYNPGCEFPIRIWLQNAQHVTAAGQPAPLIDWHALFNVDPRTGLLAIYGAVRADRSIGVE